MKALWVLLDDEGQVIRRFDYPAKGTVEIVEPKLTFDELLDEVGEAIF